MDGTGGRKVMMGMGRMNDGWMMDAIPMGNRRSVGRIRQQRRGGAAGSVLTASGKILLNEISKRRLKLCINESLRGEILVLCFLPTRIAIAIRLFNSPPLPVFHKWITSHPLHSSQKSLTPPPPPQFTLIYLQTLTFQTTTQITFHILPLTTVLTKTLPTLSSLISPPLSTTITIIPLV